MMINDVYILLFEYMFVLLILLRHWKCVVAIVASTVRWVMFMQEKEINDAKERQIQNRIKLVGTAMKK